MEKLEMLYEGKAKRVYKTNDSKKYIVEYKDDATAFNGKKKGSICDKGIINNKMSAIIFKMLEEKGIKTHFEALLSEREMIVKAVEILPLEVIVRNVAAGSLAQRLGLKEGAALKFPVLEYCYKDDTLGDPMINEYHIASIELATKEQLRVIEDYAFKINDTLREFFIEKKMKLIDFKLEFGLYDGKIILADEVSPDTCRLWDIDTNESLDKDRFRKNLGNVEESYAEVLSRLE